MFIAQCASGNKCRANCPHFMFQSQKIQPMISWLLRVIFTQSFLLFLTVNAAQILNFQTFLGPQCLLWLQTLGLNWKVWRTFSTFGWRYSNLTVGRTLTICLKGRGLWQNCQFKYTISHIHPWSWSASPQAVWGRESCPPLLCSLLKPEAPLKTSHCRSSGGACFWFYEGGLWNKALLN